MKLSKRLHSLVGCSWSENGHGNGVLPKKELTAHKRTDFSPAKNQVMILSIKDVVKTYGNYQAVNHVSFDVPKGCVFGLLGPNGAGKTSLIRMITTITGPDSGTIYLDGEKLNEKSPEKIGYMPEERGLYKKMKVGEHMLYLAQLKGLTAAQARKAVDHWFTKFDIKDWDQ